MSAKRSSTFGRFSLCAAILCTFSAVLILTVGGNPWLLALNSALAVANFCIFLEERS